MTAKKVVYIEPGDMIEVRICPPGYDKNARDWSAQTGSENKVLIRVHGKDSVSFATPQTRLVDWTDANREVK